MLGCWGKIPYFGYVVQGAIDVRGVMVSWASKVHDYAVKTTRRTHSSVFVRVVLFLFARERALLVERNEDDNEYCCKYRDPNCYVHYLSEIF